MRRILITIVVVNALLWGGYLGGKAVWNSILDYGQQEIHYNNDSRTCDPAGDPLVCLDPAPYPQYPQGGE